MKHKEKFMSLPKQLINVVERNEHTRQWLKNHSLINSAALCRSIEYDRANFWNFEYGNRDLPNEVLQRLENVLTNYGFKKIK